MYCHTCAEKSFAGMTRQKLETGTNKKKKRVTTRSMDQNQSGSKAKMKRKGSQKKSIPMPRTSQQNLSVPLLNVKRGKVRVRSAKGVRKFNMTNVPCKTQKRRKEVRKLKTEKNIKAYARSCHHSFTNLYYDF